jgi:hypothetical protein
MSVTNSSLRDPAETKTPHSPPRSPEKKLSHSPSASRLNRTLSGADDRMKFARKLFVQEGEETALQGSQEILQKIKPHLTLSSLTTAPLSEVRGTSSDSASRQLSIPSKITMILAQPQQVSTGLVFDPSLAKLRSALGKALAEAARSTDPIAQLQNGYSSLESFFLHDNRYFPFFRSVRQLMIALSDKPEIQQRILLPLLKRVLLDGTFQGGITPMEGYRFASRFLYIADHQLLSKTPESFSEIYNNIHTIVAEELEARALEVVAKAEMLSSNMLYDRTEICLSLLPLEISKTIMRANGAINLGIFDLVKEAFLPPRKDRDSAQVHISSVLRQFENDASLVHTLESIQIPKGKSAQAAINAMLFRPHDHEVSEADVHCTTLCSLLTWWRQSHIPNCFVVANGLLKQETGIRMLIDDFQELLANEMSLKKTIEGKECRFQGLLWTNPNATKAKEQKAEKFDALFSLDIVKQACRILGCEKLVEFQKAASSALAATPKEGTSLDAVFEILGSKNGKSAEEVLLACAFVEAPMQNLLMRCWENARGGIYFPPILDGNIPTKFPISSAYFKAICAAFSETARKMSLLNTNQIGKKSTSFTKETAPPSLQKLRACLIPQDISNSSETDNCSWAFFLEEEGKLIPIRSADQFILFLKGAFFEWVNIKKGLAAKGKRIHEKPFSKIQFNNEFQKYLKKNLGLSCTVKSGIIHGTFCHTMTTWDALWDLGLPPSPALKGASLKLPSQREKAIQKFFRTMKAIQEKHGLSPSLRIPAEYDGHILTFEPNTPSLIDALQRPEDVRSIAQEAVALIKNSRDNFATYCDQIAALAYMIVYEIRTDETDGRLDQEIADLIVESIESICEQKGSDTISIRDFIIIFCEQTNKVLEPLGLCLTEEKRAFFIISALFKLVGPSYNRQIIHFADTNWKCDIDGKQLALHNAFWFDPLEEKWEIICIPENNAVEFSEVEIKKFYLSSILIVENVAPLTQVIRQRELSLQNWKTAKRLQQLERKFAEVWDLYKKRSPEFTTEDLRKFFDRSTSLKVLTGDQSTDPCVQAKALVSSPIASDFERSLSICLEIRRIYSALMNRFSTPPVGERLSSAFPFRFDLSFQPLLTSEEGFKQLVLSTEDTDSTDGKILLGSTDPLSAQTGQDPAEGGKNAHQ